MIRRTVAAASALILSALMPSSTLTAQQTKDPQRASFAIQHCNGGQFEAYGYSDFWACYDDFYASYPNYPDGSQP